ncbi:MAG TPA: succinylglutamate desuccinylase/aspartoacylase family protein [Saprospiraceae bacterium]|nr:succinylglutamate desuccinylase/aspartoacylase family protein [Saprospiraceae bacterium]HPI08380.1 succinylglutamate desuccinylase/aspartoacylase family protein [Saprospiraceae bacterium]
MNRKIGQFGGTLPGPLVLAFGALHGNEPAGVEALREVIGILENEAKNQPSFVFQGKLVAFIGNLQAYQKGIRFLERDLNRIWDRDFVFSLLEEDPGNLTAESREVVEIYQAIRAEIEAFPTREIVLLDLHTTSADGGIFSIPTDETGSLALARELHVPAILRLQDSIEGPLLKFAAAGHFHTAPSKVSAIAFEAGQHTDPQSVQRSVIAIISCLRAAGCCSPGALRLPEEKLLRTASTQFPPVVILRHVHHIQPGDAFKMRPGYLNFQSIKKGEYLADDAHGRVLSPLDGMILMPLYQSKGSDGFFIVQ